MEFHISRNARDLYRVDASLFSLNGNVALPTSTPRACCPRE